MGATGPPPGPSSVKGLSAKVIVGTSWATLDGMAAQGLAFVVFLVMARLLWPELLLL